MPDLSTPEGRLEAVRSDLEFFRAEWEKLGCPLYATGAKGNDVAHPLIKMMRSAELSAFRMERQLDAREADPPPADAPPKRSLAVLPVSGGVKR